MTLKFSFYHGEAVTNERENQGMLCKLKTPNKMIIDCYLCLWYTLEEIIRAVNVCSPQLYLFTKGENK